MWQARGGGGGGGGGGGAAALARSERSDGLHVLADGVEEGLGNVGFPYCTFRPAAPPGARPATVLPGLLANADTGAVRCRARRRRRYGVAAHCGG